MKKAGSSSRSSSESSSESERSGRERTRTVLSEVSISMESPCGSLGVRQSDAQSTKTEKSEKSDDHEVGATARSTSCDIFTDQRKSRDVTPIRRKTDVESYLLREKKNPSDKTKKPTDATNRFSRRTKEKKTLQTNETTTRTVQGENDCQGCKFIEFELKTLIAKMTELERKVKWSLKIETLDTGNFTKKEELEKKIEEFQNEMLIQKSHYEKELEESMNEKERLNMELLKVEEEISMLEKETERIRKENDRYLIIIQDMRNNFSKYVREQKNEIIRSVEMNRIAKEQLYQSSEMMAKRYERMLKETCEDNLKLYIELHKIQGTLEGEDVQMLRSKAFQQQMKKKLSELSRKFKIEASSSKFRRFGAEIMQYVVYNFDAIIETILHANPSFNFLADQLALFIEEKILNEHTQFSSSHCNKQELVKYQESKSFALFKTKFRRKIYSMLEEFMKKQRKELSEKMSTVLGCVEHANQRIDASLISRIGNMSDIIALIDRKQSDLAKMEEALDYNCALVKTFSDRISSLLIKGRIDSWNFDTEKRKLRDSCIYLTNGYMNLEKRVENLEKMQEELWLKVSMCASSDDDGRREKMRRMFPAQHYESRRFLEGSLKEAQDI
ncbi:unnamed protein product [Litomosoides sigmodontis]|uniref:Uncharacterized protein n=1 Tax=Litomosoides sigmodontis TaxID=42156 RepID=A0A3P6UL27_LITSI|nr:unnamed protein product [Litomosoides sigmodontis]